ncbi:hypothetical protein D9615_001511 [Tricholomella constricta]|uniref:Uncharacterized protein n=1 Tax=Tricholomella constricta TaxID=117010 RepID=A0A8H5M8Y2_9AGAR|nr:hypothetical protein D9615_001511 [Tricholomella constricta]
MQSQPVYGNYPYYGQPIYQQPTAYMGPGPSNAYPQYTYPTNPNNPYIPQERREPPFIPPKPTAASTRPNSHRRTTTAPSVPAFFPLKSALKKTSAPPGPAKPEGLVRQVTYPPAISSQQVPRPRLPSNNFRPYTSDHNPEEFRPLHMFMLLIGNNELRLENVMDPALRELRSTIVPRWPDGVESDSQHGHDWTVRFRNNPWTLQGPKAMTAWSLIVDLFTLFARRGFSFQSSMNIGSPSPRLVFEVTSQDRTSEFFLAYFSQGGRRLHLIKPPTIVDDTLGSQLKAYLPRKITEGPLDENMRIIEVVKHGPGVPEVEPQFFLMHVLKVLSELGYNLVTTLPLGRKGPLGLRAGKEMLIFRGTIPRDPKA